jgi:AraC-like DNA-binding protein
MKRLVDIHRLNSIKELLLAIADGDLSYQIDRTEEDDELESIVVLLNWLTVELQVSLQFLSSLNLRGNQNETVHILFALDYKYTIVNISDSVTTLLGVDKSNVNGKPFSTLLNKKSVPKWEAIIEQIENDREYKTSEELFFNCGPHLRKKLPCSIHSFISTESKLPVVVITSYQLVTKQKFIEDEVKLRKIQALIDDHIPTSELNPTGSLKTKKTSQYKPKPKMMLSDRDVKMAQEIRDYILKELEYPMLSISELARKYNTNESKVKKVFTKFHNISIFRFYTEERLKRSSYLLETSRLPIYRIAKMSGFKNITHFATAFKKYYGESPSIYRKLFNKDF